MDQRAIRMGQIHAEERNGAVGDPLDLRRRGDSKKVKQIALAGEKVLSAAHAIHGPGLDQAPAQHERLEVFQPHGAVPHLQALEFIVGKSREIHAGRRS